MRRRHGRWCVAALVVTGCLLTSGAAARGDACSECGPPTREDLEQDPGFVLEVRGPSRDYVELHGGECRIELTDAPRIHKDRSWLVLRGSGAVWNCPSSVSSDTMTATVTRTDRREWSLSASSSVSASVLGVGLSAQVVASVSEASTVQEVTTISKEMSAKYCRIIAWFGYFEVADYSAEVDFRIERRFAWWTKNAFTGSTVHRKGEIWLDCGAHTATLDMRAPIAGYFNLRQYPCVDGECKLIPTADLGWYPPLPGGLQPPVTPGDDEPDDDDAGSDAGTGSGTDDAPEAPPGEEPSSDSGSDAESSDAVLPSSDELGEAPTGAVPDPLADAEEASS